MEELKNRLNDWIAKHSTGIYQHSDGWTRARRFTIGGSSLACIQGVDPYKSIFKMISERIGQSSFGGNVNTQWGNLFEYIIKRYTEIRFDCAIAGDNLYIAGPPDTSYSPDGMAVMRPPGVDELVIALLEFKCLYSRIPRRAIPVQYLPQVKMGLVIVDVAQIGLYIEGVFRRCSWEQLGNNPLYDLTLVPRSIGDMPLAYGIIGFYTDSSVPSEYAAEYVEAGTRENDYLSNDLGSSSPDLFRKIMMNLYAGVDVWYGRVIIPSDDISPINEQLSAYTQFCREGNRTNLGILPWKLFHINCVTVEKEPDYLEPWLPKIHEVVDVVRRCLDPNNADKKMDIFNSYVNNDEGFYE